MVNLPLPKTEKGAREGKRGARTRKCMEGNEAGQ